MTSHHDSERARYYELLAVYDELLAKYREREAAYRELIAEHFRMREQVDRQWAVLRVLQAELERLRGLDRAQAAERDERLPFN
jgi:hypothetical protein